MSMTRKVALITGITGQDGSYLAELLLAKGYEVHGLVRGPSLEISNHRPSRIQHLHQQLTLHPCTLTSFASLLKVVQKVSPDEVYHLAAQSYVSYAFDTEYDTINTNILATHNLLAVLREHSPQCKFFFSGSSEMFGVCQESPQNESTPFNPRSIYGISKLAAYHLVKNYREQFGLQASVGIMYNHESPRRGHEYVTRKVTSFVASLKRGRNVGRLKLGNLESVRDWGYAPDYVEAMWLMLQRGGNEDYVIASGKTNSVRRLLELAFGHVGLSYEDHIEIDPNFYRKEEKVPLCGSPAKAHLRLGWHSTKDLREIVSEMVESELKSGGEVG